MNAVAHVRGRGAVAGEVGLTVAQALLLRTADELDHPTVGAVAAALGIASPSATRMLQQLERRGMVRRDRSELDERATVITVTPDGARALEEFWQRIRERQRQLYAGVDPRLRPALTELLLSMRDVINDI
ncbi:DNA-binding MarR family transcriptional regulator [Spinactinospora alkalitolerans]|uniref:DNA-binding MarR family transcriptional regulator n=2 Tax=Spinactinospora alkalitolerans TaxID=687207 RepID=A0A852TM42_9ACTN|nr:DNA-binding MarR family transcriptional regulator [Spinactinospora alkalitolerans]